MAHRPPASISFFGIRPVPRFVLCIQFSRFYDISDMTPASDVFIICGFVILISCVYYINS